MQDDANIRVVLSNYALNFNVFNLLHGDGIFWTCASVHESQSGRLERNEGGGVSIVVMQACCQVLNRFCFLLFKG